MYEMIKASESEDGATVLVLTFNDSGSVRDYAEHKAKIDEFGLRQGGSLTNLCGIAHWWNAAERVADDEGIKMQVRRNELRLAAAFLSKADCDQFLVRFPEVLRDELLNGSNWEKDFLKKNLDRFGRDNSYTLSAIHALCDEYGMTPQEYLGEELTRPDPESIERAARSLRDPIKLKSEDDGWPEEDVSKSIDEDSWPLEKDASKANDQGWEYER